MEMHQVRYFLATARLLNFTHAAEECNVAQPSLTRAIKQLEEELGGALFRRERKLSHLTDLGQRMVPFMQQCYDSALLAKSTARSVKSGNIAALAIGVSDSVNVGLIIPSLIEIISNHPRTAIEFRRGTNEEIAEYLKKGTVELAVAGPLGETWNRLESWELFKEPYRLAIGADHPIARRQSIKAEDFAQQRVFCRTHCDHPDTLGDYFKDRGVPADLMHKVSSETDLVGLLRANLGIAIAPESSACAEGIVLIDPDKLDVDRPLYVYAVAGRERSLPASALLKELRTADWAARRTAVCCDGARVQIRNEAHN